VPAPRPAFAAVLFRYSAEGDAHDADFYDTHAQEHGPRVVAWRIAGQSPFLTMEHANRQRDYHPADGDAKPFPTQDVVTVIKDVVHGLVLHFVAPRPACGGFDPYTRLICPRPLARAAPWRPEAPCRTPPPGSASWASGRPLAGIRPHTPGSGSSGSR